MAPDCAPRVTLAASAAALRRRSAQQYRTLGKVSGEEVDNVVREAAAKFAAVIVGKAGGKMPPPTDEYKEEWTALAHRIGVLPVPLVLCPWSFTARLEYDKRHDVWLWVYNRNRTPYEKACYFCHEIGEYLCICDMPELHAELNAQARVFNYTGDPNPSEVHHRVGCEVERILMDKKRLEVMQDATGELLRSAEETTDGGNDALKKLAMKIVLFRDQIDLCRRQIESMDRQIDSLDEKQTS